MRLYITYKSDPDVKNILVGLREIKEIEIVEDIKESDYMIVFSCVYNLPRLFKDKPYKMKRMKEIYNEYLRIKDYPVERVIIVDYTDYSNLFCLKEEDQQKCLLYFKRMCVERKNNISYGLKKYNREVIPIGFYIREDSYNYVNSRRLERDYDISCLFNGKDRGLRRDIYNHLVKRKSNKIFVGCIERKKKYYNEVNNGYLDQLLRSKIIVTSNPKNHEGDYRLYEALLCGGLVLVDKFIVPVINSFRDREHLVYYSSLEELDKLLEYYLLNEEERERIALNGREYALRNHRGRNRGYEIYEEIRRVIK